MPCFTQAGLKLLTVAIALQGCHGSDALPTHPPEQPVVVVSLPRDENIDALVEDLGVPKGGLHAPYCMPFPNSEADTAIARLAEIGQRSVPYLIERLDDSNVYRRSHCAMLLGDIGGEAALEALCRAIRVERNSKEWLIGALGKFRSDKAVRALLPVLSSGIGRADAGVFQIEREGTRAARAIANIGKLALPLLEDAERSEDEATRTNAQFAASLIRSGSGG